MRLVRFLAVALTLVMAATVVYGLVSGDFGDEGAEILGLAWGRVTLIDLYVGLIVFGAWIAIRETSWAARIMWWVALVVLGNLAAAAYLLVASFTSNDRNELMFGT
ncbi:MAG: DUF1475 family protein [Acidimicrobiia bacterium]|jgi:hypothetical protein